MYSRVPAPHCHANELAATTQVTELPSEKDRRLPLRWRDLAIGMALANLCYLRIWSEALTYDRADTFWMKHPPLPAELLALIFNVTLVGALLACGATVCDRPTAIR